MVLFVKRTQLEAGATGPATGLWCWQKGHEPNEMGGYPYETLPSNADLGLMS